MNEVDTRYRFQFSDLNGKQRGRRQNYRDKLNRPSYASLDAGMDNDVALADPSSAYVARVRALADVAGRDSTVFQSVVVAAVQTLQGVLDQQRHAVAASISLAQGDKMRGMVEITEAMTDALRATLSPQGVKMLQLCTDKPARRGDPSWWFALTETIEGIEQGIERMSALVYGQPKGAPARKLSSLVVRLLHNQHISLLAEAEQWIS